MLRPYTKEWKEICPNLCEDGLDLLKSLLQYAPHKRISAREAGALSGDAVQ